jgi:hypothetical protein
MITGQDIKPGEIVRILANTDDVEEEMYAKALRNTGDFLYVTYLSATDMLYKGACVYGLESVVNPVQYESITEHHEGVTDLCEIGMCMPSRNCFVLENEIDSEDSCSDVITDDDDDDGSDLDDFIDDGPVEGRIEPPPGATVIDEEWNSWQPSTEGGRHFKDTVDRLEERARAEADEHNF